MLPWRTLLANSFRLATREAMSPCERCSKESNACVSTSISSSKATHKWIFSTVSSPTTNLFRLYIGAFILLNFLLQQSCVLKFNHIITMMFGLMFGLLEARVWPWPQDYAVHLRRHTHVFLSSFETVTHGLMSSKVQKIWRYLSSLQATMQQRITCVLRSERLLWIPWQESKKDNTMVSIYKCLTWLKGDW